MANHFVKLIKEGGFRNLWFAQILSQVSLNMLSFVLAIWVYQKTKSNAAVSFMLLAFAIPSVIFGFVAGGVVDYFDKRKVLLLCNISRTILLALFFFYNTNLVVVFALAILIAIITQFFIPAEAPAIPMLVSQKRLLTANSLFTVSFYLSSITGFISAGPFLKIFGHNNIYLVMTFLLSLATFFTYRLPKLLTPETEASYNFSFSSIGRTIDQGIQFIRHHKRVWQSLILMTFSQALVATLAVLAPGFADQILGIELADASYLVMGPGAIGLVIGSLLVGGYGMNFLKGSIILTGIVSGGSILMLLSVISSISSILVNLSQTQGIFSIINLAFVMLLILGLSNSFISVPANTILQEETDNSMRGRIYGVLTSLTGGVSFLPVIFSGILADIFGISRALFILGSLVIIVGIYHFLQRRKVGYTIK